MITGNDIGDEALWPKEILDRDYNARASVSVEVFEAEMAHESRYSEAARRSNGCILDVVYDERSGQAIDFYGTSSTPKPVFLYIHGGYWRALSKRDSAFMAEALAQHSIVTAVLDYRLAPSVNLTEIVREAHAAISFLSRDGAKYGVDPNRIYVGGSSAGGHLAGTVLAGGWHEEFSAPENVIKGGMLFSGLFHLAPIAKCFVQDWMSLTEQELLVLSPALNIPRHGPPILVVYGEREPDGFIRQSKRFYRLWREAGFSSKLIEVQNRNHFDVVHELIDAESSLTKRLVRMIHAS
jgi:arylformamidase